MYFRNLVNHYLKAGAIKILKIVKANYTVTYINPRAIKKDKTYIYMSNHQSLMDIPLIYAACSGTIRMVTKAELFNIPIFGKALHAGECIPVERKNKGQRETFIENVKQKLRSGVSVWFFPEGTRSSNGNLLPFKTGGFHVAGATQTEIVPVAVINTRSILPPKRFTLSFKQCIHICIGEPITIPPITSPEALNDAIAKVRLLINHLLNKSGCERSLA